MLAFRIETPLKKAFLIAIVLVCVACPVFSQKKKSKKTVHKKPVASAPTPAKISLEVSQGKQFISPGSESTLTAVVYDKNDKVIHDIPLKWSVDKDSKRYVFAAPGDDGSTFSLLGRTVSSDAAESHPFVVVQVSVDTAPVATGIVLPYQGAKVNEASSIEFDGKELTLSPGSALTVTATRIIDGSGNSLSPEQVAWSIDDPVAAKLVHVGRSTRDANGYHVELFGIKPTDKDGSFPKLFLLTARVGGRPLGYASIYGSPADGTPTEEFKELDADYMVLPKKIAEHVFGKSIANDFYCITIHVSNDSDDEYQVSTISFMSKDGYRTMAVPYEVVSATENRRKMLNMRNLMPLIASGLSTVLSGFTPFFVNIPHQNQYQKFVNLLSVPSRDTVEKVWPNTLNLYSTNIDTLALRGDKIITKTATPLTSMLFVPQKSLFGDKVSDNPAEIRERLGDIVVDGYVIKKTSNKPKTLNKSAPENH